MPDDDRKKFTDTLTRTSALVTALCSSPLYFLFAYLGDPGRGTAAAMCMFVVITSARAFWDGRKSIWFWVTLVIVVLLHTPFILLVPWSNRSYPGIVLAPVGLVDFGFSYGFFALAQKAMALSERTADNL
ncbi:MAG TPA: hypothetical protein VGU46_08280 [Acidobacteriaceae bacterium]|nr:hypothetical protein [Acidobacteriaceae bacterium]